MDIIKFFQNEPLKAIIIFFVLYVIIMILVISVLAKRRKKKAEVFLNQNEDAAVIQLLTKGKGEKLASIITVKSVNGEKPVLIGVSAQQLYVQPGINKIHVIAEWSEFSLFARGHSKFISADSTIEISAQAKETYTIKYNIKDEKFVVDKL